MRKVNLKDAYNVYKEEGGTMDYRTYSEIVRNFHKRIVEKIIEGYEYELPFHLGKLSIVQVKRVIGINKNNNLTSSVDWGNSNKLKKEIIERGDIPLEMVKDEFGIIIGNNGGVPWMCYHVSDTFFAWHHTKNIWLTNHPKYQFKITWHNKKALVESITKESDILYKSYSYEHYKKGFKLAYLTGDKSTVSD